MPRNRKIMASLVELKKEHRVIFLVSNYKNSWCCPQHSCEKCTSAHYTFGYFNI
jgi:hypothetical protein